jgi:hypothetical protein
MTLPPMNSEWPSADRRDAEFSAPRTHPWRRFFACHIDIVLIAVAVAGLGSLVFEPRGANSSGGAGRFSYGASLLRAKPGT